MTGVLSGSAEVFATVRVRAFWAELDLEADDGFSVGNSPPALPPGLKLGLWV